MSLSKCRLCNCKNLISVINLGRQINTSIFPKIGELNKVESYSVNLLMCEKCGLIQIDETTPPDLMYKTGNYGYKSSISNTMRTHLKNYHLIKYLNLFFGVALMLENPH